MAEIEAIIEPDCVTNNVRRESVAFVGIHSPILPISAGLLVSTRLTYIDFEDLKLHFVI